MTHICVSDLTSIGSDNGLSPGRRQAIIWTTAGIMLIGPLGTNLSENSIEILTFSFMQMRLKVSSAKWWPFCLGLNVLKKATQICSKGICRHSDDHNQVVFNCSTDSAIEWTETKMFLMAFSSLVAPEVVIMATSDASYNENFVKLNTWCAVLVGRSERLLHVVRVGCFPACMIPSSDYTS